VQCVEITVEGFVVASEAALAECPGFVLLAPAELDRMTYWADLAIALDPSEPALWAVMGAMLTMHAVFYGLKAIRDILRRPST
jgi:hypothetical protein